MSRPDPTLTVNQRKEPIMLSGEYIVAQNAHAALEAARENLTPVIVEAEERYTG